MRVKLEYPSITNIHSYTFLSKEKEIFDIIKVVIETLLPSDELTLVHSTSGINSLCS